jgi:hypothetical protein
LHEEVQKENKNIPIHKPAPAENKKEEEMDSNDFSYLNNVYL